MNPNVNWKLNRLWIWLLALPVLLGIFFRFIHLEAKVYWVDEVATSIRIAGTTKALLTQQLATGQLLTVQHLLDVQQLHPALPWSATLAALYHSPEHAPLYFLFARFWLQLTGNGIAQIRSLSVLFSLLSLPALFWLCEELFHSRRTSWIGVMLLSVSPFFVAYAQEARPYSLWSLTLLLMGATLLRAVRTQQRQDWLLYAVAAAIGLYTSLLSLLVLGGQGIYVSLCWGKQRLWWIRAAIGAVLLFSPWIGVILSQLTTLHDNTTWTRLPLGLLPMLATWIYTLAVLFFDVPVVLNPPIVGMAQVTIAAILVGLMGFALRELIQKTPREVWLFVVVFWAALPVPLIVFDLFANGRLSTAPRYMMPVLLGVLLTIAFFLSDRIPDLFKHPFRQRFWSGVLVGLIAISICSCLFQLQQPSRYHKTRSLSNPAIAAVINQANAPLLLAEASQVMDLLSISHLLKPEVQIRIAPAETVLNWANSCQTTFLFNPSAPLKQLFQQQGILLRNRYQPQPLVPTEMSLSLWQVQPAKANQRCAYPLI
ncbi:glycosyltransferase family 39 protein [Leptolyngbya sp. ST-U4]|uniref:glycosyltransferase family 39 protein n=1 Tax=Leptolyngbya sp. ST-U4 TaxID=2933912 RepID=UPI0032970D19